MCYRSHYIYVRRIMGSFVIFGLGSFGFHTASALIEEKQQVMAIDHDEEKIQDIKNIVTSAVVADVTDKRTLKSLGIEDIDAAVISLSGNAFADTVLLTLHLKEIGIKNIIARVTNDDEAKILTMLGATQVIFGLKAGLAYIKSSSLRSDRFRRRPTTLRNFCT